MNDHGYSTKAYEKAYLLPIQGKHEICFLSTGLNEQSVEQAHGCTAVCCFVTDILNAKVLAALAALGVKLIALRSAGFDHVDLAAAKQHRLTVVNVPKYSPYAVAEFTLLLILSLRRKIIPSYQRCAQYHFSLESTMGVNLHGQTVGIIGTGHIGGAFINLLQGFACSILAYDPMVDASCQHKGVEYQSLDEVLAAADIVSLHCPLTKDNHHMINAATLAKMKPKSMLINTARGALVDTRALIQALESGHIAYAGLDVYERELGLFFMDHADGTIKDEDFLHLSAMDNVLITPHQAFFTEDAVSNIMRTTMDNMTAFEQGRRINIVNASSR